MSEQGLATLVAIVAFVILAAALLVGLAPYVAALSHGIVPAAR